MMGAVIGGVTGAASNYDVEITRNEFMESTSSLTSNLERLIFTVPQTGYYTMKVILRDKNDPDVYVWGVIALHSLYGYSLIRVGGC